MCFLLHAYRISVNNPESVSNSLHTVDVPGMDLFGKILPGVRGIVCDASSTQIQALLDLMLEGGVISKEYYQTLLHERDREDLARKISLTLVEKSAMQLSQHGSASARSMNSKFAFSSFIIHLVDIFSAEILPSIRS